MSGKYLFSENQSDDPTKGRIEFLRLPGAPQREKTLKGRERISLQDAAMQAAQKIPANDPGAIIGGVRAPSKTNTSYSGSTQYGKTSVQKVDIYQVLQRMNSGNPEKIILYDADGEFIPYLYAHLNTRLVDVVIMNPADARCSQWDINADHTGPSNLHNLTSTAIKSQPHDTQFFTASARNMLSGVLEGWDYKGGIPYDFRDLACATLTPERIRAVLEEQPAIFRPIINAYLDRENQDIYSTLQAHMKQFIIIAAMWDGRPKFSLKQFFASARPGIVVLSSDRNNRSSIIELNRLIIDRAAQILLSGESLDETRYHFFLDEFASLGKLEWIGELIREGLKYGIRTNISYQQFQTVREKYGHDAAAAIIGQCSTKYFFHESDKESAEHSAGMIGQAQILRKIVAHNYGWSSQTTLAHSHSTSDSISEGISNSDGSSRSRPDGWFQKGNKTKSKSSNSGTSSNKTSSNSSTYSESHTTGTNYSRSVTPQYVDEWVVRPGELQNLQQGEFYCVTPSVQGVWSNQYNWQVIEPIVNAKSNDPRYARFIERTNEPYLGYLRDWDSTDLARLGLTANVLTPGATRNTVLPEEDALPSHPPLLKAANQDEEESFIEKAKRFLRR